MAAPQRRPAPEPDEPEEEPEVLSAQGAFRVLIIVIAVWTLFAGFSLFTQGLGRISFGGDDEAAERIIGAFMLILVPLYALMAWKRDEYHLLVWVPFAAQLAVLVPMLWDLLFGTRDIDDGVLMFVVSLIFLVLLIYVWQASGPASLFGGAIAEEFDDEDEDEDEEIEDDEDFDEDDDVGQRPGGETPGGQSRGGQTPGGRSSTGAL